MQNVKDSDATAIIYFGKLQGGTEQTVRYCIEQDRPHQLIDAEKTSATDAAQLILDFVREHNIANLNVAGPRESEWSEGYDFAFRTTDRFLSKQDL